MHPATEWKLTLTICQVEPSQRITEWGRLYRNQGTIRLGPWARAVELQILKMLRSGQDPLWQVSTLNPFDVLFTDIQTGRTIYSSGDSLVQCSS